MRKILVNGDFFCRRLTGIERYAYEITAELDAISRKDEIAVIVPFNAPQLPAYKNLRILRHTRKIRSHLFWQMVDLQWFLITHPEYIVLEYGNTVLPFAPGIVFLHDIYCELYPKDFKSFRDKIIRLYNRIQYRLIAHCAKKIVTVSAFSRKQIMDYFAVKPDKISVAFSSWNHFAAIEPDYTVFDEHPELARPFYFSLGSLSARKNMGWILKYALEHPQTLFAVSGTALPTVKSEELLNGALPNNIMLLGYLDDAKVKALMQKCKAFISPSYYEGFGLTPLEALSCGAKAIVANAASLPEIYGNTVRYLDPFDTHIDLDLLADEAVDAPDTLLETYSYKKSAQKVYAIILDTV